MYILLAVFFVILAVYMFSLVTNDYTQTVAGQSTYGVIVAGLRGTIYDRNLKPITNDKKTYKAAVAPDESLLPILRPAMSATDYRTLLGFMADRKPSAVFLKKPVAVHTGLRQFFVPTRYGDRLLAPHLIGYLDSSGTAGVTGLEAAYNDVLQHYAGSVRVSFTVDGSGRCLQGIEPTVTDTSQKTKGGLVLTLDKQLQQTIEELMPQYLKKGAVVVSDPNDGALLAAASYPSFQPQTVTDSLERDDGALVNRALALYDCGSVFKIITAAAALENGVSSQQAYTCAGSLDVGGTLFHCHNRLGHQQQTMEEAMANSCNLYFIQLAHQVGAAAVFRMAENFGLSTTITLADNVGAAACTLPTLSELEQSPAALANFSFGQGKLLLSPLHVAKMTVAIANDGYMITPYLVKGVVDDKGVITKNEKGRGEQIVSYGIAKAIQKMLEKVVTEGTGQTAKPSFCTAAGKTGTAETGQQNGEKPVVQSWFTGYIPADDPQYVITILAEDAQNTNAQATSLFCEISNNLMK